MTSVDHRTYLRATEVARRLGVTLRTVRRWIRDGTIPSIKVGGTRLVDWGAFESRAWPGSCPIIDETSE